MYSILEKGEGNVFANAWEIAIMIRNRVISFQEIEQSKPARAFVFSTLASISLFVRHPTFINKRYFYFS